MKMLEREVSESALGNSTVYKFRYDTVQPTGERASSIPQIRFPEEYDQSV